MADIFYLIFNIQKNFQEVLKSVESLVHISLALKNNPIDIYL